MSQTDTAQPKLDDVENGTITFFEFFEPPLKSGDYTLNLEQHVQSTDLANSFDETFQTVTTFAVQGVRFSIPPTYVQTMFPPLGNQGEYSSVLPHVVFTINTLPWQRTADPNVDGIPWLALLTFDQSDPVPVLQSGTIASLAALLPAGTVSYPDLKLEYGETWADLIQFIDIPWTLFAKIAPTVTDLKWLAHARSISTDVTFHKADLGSASAPQEFSVVVSNRLPTPGSKTVCFLVSVEDMESYLPKRGVAPPTEPAAVRLAVLGTWSFGSVDEPVTFSEYFAQLNEGYTTTDNLQVPYLNLTGTPNKAIADALEMGFTAINHHTRQGADTVTWYRGPLTPYDNGEYVTVPITSADALVRYNPDNGMFDVSLSAAWQLGQMLALNDKAFASLLYNWKRGQTETAVNEFEKAFLAGKVGIDISLVSEPGVPTHMQLMKNVLKPLFRTLLDQRLATNE